MMRYNPRKIFIVAVWLLVTLITKAQPGCPAINAGNSLTLPCGTNCTTLRATPFEAGATDAYTVSQIPYTPFSYTAGTSVLVNQDDIWGDVITLPFNFCFYGQVYNQAVIGANGLITFELSRANQTCAYDLTSGNGINPIPDPTGGDANFTNSIMFPYQDIDPELGGTVTYQIIGTAPCRIFVVSFADVPLYASDDFLTNCFGTTNTTCQAVLYETTNVIEMYIKDKDECTDWNDGLAIEGIMDATGTVATAVPGRNLTTWTAHNDAWRFTPSGPSIVSVSWFKGATQISSDSFVTVCPSAQTTYTAQAVYTPCAGGTPITVTDNVTVSLAGSLGANIDSVKNISCTNPTGSAYASVTGGNPPVTYGWSNGSSSLSITNLAAGTYVFTASDALGCTRSDTVHITTLVPMVASVPNVTQTNCSGNGTGTLTANVTGGNTPYTYVWTNGEAGISDTAIQPGTYTITATDATGCTVTASGIFAINVGGNTVSMGAPTINDISCYGLTNGTIIATAAGGAQPYTYVWNNNRYSDTLSNVGVGSYTVSATDANGCTASATYSVSQPTQLIINAANVQSIGCGYFSGAITVSAQGGTANYTFNWTEQSNNQTYTGTNLSNLVADTYILTVTDANGCTDSASYQITQSTQLVFTTDSTLTSCYGSGDGSAFVSIVSGTPPYTFTWDGDLPVTDSVYSNVPAGPVDVIVSDASNCSIEAVIQVNQPTPVSIGLVSESNVSCFDSTDGSITISASGGTPGYTYAWSNTATGPTNAGIIAGNYGVLATDANGCTAAAAFTVSQPTAISINTPGIQNIGCQGGNSGSITANVTQGSPPYTYTWLQQPGGQIYNGQTINNLAVATYYLLVTDSHGCNDTSSYNITAIPLLTFTTDSVPVSCYNGNNGGASVSITSGTPPYQFIWNNEAAVSDSVITNLDAGPVDIAVTDANNCLTRTTINITQPAPIVITQTSQTNVLCNGGNNGELVVSASGGTPGYTYNWSNQFIGTDNQGLAAGNYIVIVVDNNACADTAQYTITQPTALVATPVAVNALCNGSADGSVDANPSNGSPAYSYIWNDGQTTRVATYLARGSYSCTVTDSHGCSVIATDTVGQPAPLIPSGTTTAVKCIGQKSGTAVITATGDTPPYFYNATQDGVNFVASTNGTILGLDTGVYTVQVSDSFGCETEIYVYVNPAIPDGFLTSTDSTLCFGPQYNDGAALIIDTTLENGPYQYSIDGGGLQDSGYFQNLSAGDHYIIAVNHNGCIDTIPVVVPEPLPVIAAVTPDSITLPLGGSQQVLVTYLNATNPSYNWTNSLGLSCSDCPNPVVSAYEPGDYVVVVSMVNGDATCYGSTTLHVNVLPHTKSFVPNAFTPNGDGNNDVFQVFGEDIKTLNMKVFNRWGELVYSTTNSMAGWDGTYKGVLQQPSVFTYEVEITYLDNTTENKKGTVTLIR